MPPEIPAHIQDELDRIAWENQQRENGFDEAEIREWVPPPRKPNGHTNGNGHANGHANYTRKPATAFTYKRFLETEFPRRPVMFSPWLPQAGLAMIYAPRGTGKTRLVHGVAWACATGSGFLKWGATRPYKALVLDGEMPTATLQDYLRSTVDASGTVPAIESNFRIACSDYEERGLPDLANRQNWQFYADLIADAELVLVDNISTFCPSTKENEGDAWGPMQEWLLGYRRLGKTIVLVHHSNKSGGQRGSIKKEDVLDTVVALKRPPDYTAKQGARFEVHFEKSRTFYGDDAEPFEAWLRGDQWQLGELKSGDDDDTIKVLRAEGLSFREIADRTGVPLTTLHRRVKDLEDAA